MPCPEKRQFKAKQIDRHHVRTDSIVLDFRIGATGNNLQTSYHVAVFGMTQQELRYRTGVSSLQIFIGTCHIAPRRQWLFIGGHRLVKPFTQPWFKLFLRCVPDPGLCVPRRPINIQRPAIDLFDQLRHLRQRHCTVNAKCLRLIGAHAMGHLVDQRTVRLCDQCRQLFLALKPQ